VRGSLTFQKLTKTSLLYSVLCFNLGAWSFAWGAKPTKAACGDWTDASVTVDQLLIRSNQGA